MAANIYFAKDGRIYARTSEGVQECGTALTANGRDLEAFERALNDARRQRIARTPKGRR